MMFCSQITTACTATAGAGDLGWFCAFSKYFLIRMLHALKSAAREAERNTSDWKLRISMNILETDRLILCKLSPDHAAFILELLNDPSFLQFIGDKGVKTLDDAQNYILNGPINSYERFGLGLYLTKLKDGGAPIGICGLLKRDTLQDVDIGFAFLPEFWSKGYAFGYAFESASAVMVYGLNDLGVNASLP